MLRSSILRRGACKYDRGSMPNKLTQCCRVVADAQLGLQLVTGFLASYQFWVHDVREFLGFGKPRIRATSSFDLEGELERMRSEAQTHGLIFDLEIHDPRSK